MHLCAHGMWAKGEQGPMFMYVHKNMCVHMHLGWVCIHAYVWVSMQPHGQVVDTHFCVFAWVDVSVTVMPMCFMSWSVCICECDF